MKKETNKPCPFNESSWSKISLLLPEDEVIRKVVLDDFIWFMNRPKEYRSDKEKVEDYIRHLRLKGNSQLAVRCPHSHIFKSIEVQRILSVLSHQ